MKKSTENPPYALKKTTCSIIIKGGKGLNTNDEKIQWHPAFDAVLQIEFGDEAKYPELCAQIRASSLAGGMPVW